MKQIRVPQSLARLAYEQVKRYILEGKLGEGVCLTEEFVARQLGISKSPVREALNRLEAEGLIRIAARRGAFLNTFSVKEIRDVYDLREALEVHAVRTARILPRLLSDLNESVQRQRDYLDRHEKTRYIDEDIRFHELIAKATGNDRLVHVLANLQNQLVMFRDRTYDITSSPALKAHLELCAALAGGDRERALELMREHIANTRDRLVQDVTAEPRRRRVKSSVSNHILSLIATRR